MHRWSIAARRERALLGILFIRPPSAFTGFFGAHMWNSQSLLLFPLQNPSAVMRAYSILNTFFPLSLNIFHSENQSDTYLSFVAQNTFPQSKKVNSWRIESIGCCSFRITFLLEWHKLTKQKELSIALNYLNAFVPCLSRLRLLCLRDLTNLYRKFLHSYTTLVSQFL